MAKSHEVETKTLKNTKKHIFIAFFLFIFVFSFDTSVAHAATCGVSTDFVTTWRTESDNESITIPTTGGGYNYQVDWGDGSPIENGLTGNTTHQYNSSGDYEVRICGDFPRFYLNNDDTNRDKIIDINQWGDNNWTSMASAFYGASNLTGTYSDSPDLSGVTSLASMFYGASAFNGTLNDWDVSNVTSTKSMLRNASVFNQPLNNWDTSSMTNISFMFQNATEFNQPLDNWDTSSLTTTQSMFRRAANFNQPLDMWDMSNVTNISVMFLGAHSFNQPLNSWDTSNVTNMGHTFEETHIFNQPLDNWDTSKVTSMRDMFQDAHVFNQPLDMWDVSQVRDMKIMFYNARSFNQPLNSWDVSSVTNMSNMFTLAVSFNQPLDNWDVSNVTNFGAMFGGYSTSIDPNDENNVIVGSEHMPFNQDISGWNTSSATNMSLMFAADIYDWYEPLIIDAGYSVEKADGYSPNHEFNQDISSWNTSNVTDMELMFAGANNFDVDLGGWDMSNVVEIGYMLSGSGLSEANYDATLVGWSTQTLQPSLTFGVDDLVYCNSVDQRQSIIDTYNWTFSGDYYCVDTDNDGFYDHLDEDDDNDGISDEIEDSAINGGDGNDDGILDSLQINVASTTSSDGKKETLEVKTACQSVTNMVKINEDELPSQDPEYTYPAGLTDYSLSCSNSGDVAEVTIYFDEEYDTNEWVVRKYINGTFSTLEIDNYTIGTETVGSDTVTTLNYFVADGGELDEDGVANGTIVDPIGAAFVEDPESLAATGDNQGLLLASLPLLAIIGIKFIAKGGSRYVYS